MTGKVIFEMQSPVTQSVQAVESLASYLNKTIGNGILDLGAVKLVKSNKGDAFYTVTEKACSCPSATYRPGQPCKHQRQYFAMKPTQAREESLRPVGKWAGGNNGPVAIEVI